MQHPSSSGSHPTRRDFLVSTGALAAGLTLASAPVAQGAVEKLALNGGPKAVTAPIDEACKWPRYGKTEEKAVLCFQNRLCNREDVGLRRVSGMRHSGECGHDEDLQG